MATFKELWDNHPTIKNNDNPFNSNGMINFPNQCAIRLGICLQNSGYDTTKFSNVKRCWQHDKSKGRILRAEELAEALKKQAPFLHGIQRTEEVDPKKFSSLLAGKKGIIFFKDYWRRTIDGVTESFRNRTGDHIDLWNGLRLTDWFTWVRIQTGFSWEGRFSDFGNSKEIWFWRVV